MPLAILGVVVAGAIAHVAVSAKRVEAGIEVGRARRERDELLTLRRGLEIEIGVLKDPGRISRLAQDTLNMGPPAADRIVRPQGLPR
jgi:cell division protein FtsL